MRPHRYVTVSLLNNRSLISIPERGYNCKKNRNLNYCTQLNNGKINMLGLSGHIKLGKITNDCTPGLEKLSDATIGQGSTFVALCV